MTLWFHSQYRAGSLADNTFGDTAHQNVHETRSTMSPNHDQIDVLFPCIINDLDKGRSDTNGAHDGLVRKPWVSSQSRL